MKKLMSFFVAISICVLLTGTLFSQETGEIAGKVVDEEGTTLPGVSVIALSPNLQGQRNAVSGNNGSFRLSLLPVGKYTLTFELQGFAKVVQENVRVKLGMVTSINVTMKVATIEEQVTVIAEAALIDKTIADTSTHFGEIELKNVPVQGRTIQEIVNFAPGVTSVRVNTTLGVGGGGTNYGSPSFRGEGETSNNWFVDGLSKRGAWDHEIGTRVNYDSWEEVQVISDPFSPESGTTYGGVVNIVTKTGGNEFHGELGALILPNSLRAARKEQLSVTVEPETSTNNYFGNIGGPILKDKLWFFISNNFWQTSDKTEAGNIDWLEIPAGDRSQKTNNFFGKLTFSPISNHSVSFSGTYDKFLSQSGGIGLPNLYTKTDYKNYAYRLNYKGILGPDTLLEFIIGRSSRHNTTEPLSGDTDAIAYYHMDINSYTNNVYTVQDIIDRRTDFSSRFTQYLSTERFGNHELGLGFLYYNIYKGDFIDVTGDDWDLWPDNGFDAGGRIHFQSPGIPYRFRENAAQNFHNKTDGFGIYLKDKISFDRFTVMIGVRAETEKVYNDADEVVIDWGLTDFISPRFSLAWDITGDGINIFKVGIAQFTDTVLFDFLGLLNTQGGWRSRFYNWTGPTPYETEAQLRDLSNWEFIFQQGPSGEPAMTVKEGSVPDKQTRVVVEFNRALGPNWALKLRGVYSNHHDMLEDLAFFTQEANEYWQLQNWDVKRRNYKGIEAEMNGRISNRFFLNTSYVWSKAKGTTPGSRERAGGYNTWSYNTTGTFGDHYSGPADSPLAFLANWGVGLGGKDYGDEGYYGLLPYSCDHVVKILGSYLAPYGLNISASFEWNSGYYWSIKALQYDYGQYFSFLTKRGTEKAPAHSYFDLSIQKDFAFSEGITLGVRANVTNLFNSQTAVSFMNGYESLLFGQVYGRQFPRWFQIQAILRF